MFARTSLFCTPCRTRTYDRPLRRRMLYPSELRGRVESIVFIPWRKVKAPAVGAGILYFGTSVGRGVGKTLGACMSWLTRTRAMTASWGSLDSARSKTRL